jgi:uncharacterized damage-inducible protein DinB
MGLQQLMKDYASYNKWANATLVSFLKTQSANVLTRETLSSFPSIEKTIQHIIDGESFWIEEISKSNAAFKAPVIINLGGDIFTLFIETSYKLEKFIHALSEAELQMTMPGPWIKETVPVYDAFQHCLTHSSYHRGQLTTIFRQLGLTGFPTVGYYEYIMNKVKPIR